MKGLKTNVFLHQNTLPQVQHLPLYLYQTNLDQSKIH